MGLHGALQVEARHMGPCLDSAKRTRSRLHVRCTSTIMHPQSRWINKIDS